MFFLVLRDGHHGWAMFLCNLLHIQEIFTIGIADQFHGFVHIFNDRPFVAGLQLVQHSLNDRKRHLAQSLKFLVVVNPLQQVHLGDCGQSTLLKDIDEQTRFHPIA